MSARPDSLDSSATALLGDNAYPESQVSYGGATYWLERSADGIKRLVAVADDASVFDLEDRIGDDLATARELAGDRRGG